MFGSDPEDESLVPVLKRLAVEFVPVVSLEIPHRANLSSFVKTFVTLPTCFDFSLSPHFHGTVA